MLTTELRETIVQSLDETRPKSNNLMRKWSIDNEADRILTAILCKFEFKKR